MQADLPLKNVPEFSVTDLAMSLKRTLEDTYGHVRLRGELGRLTFHSSGHLYGNIKDDKAAIDIVCWRGTLNRLSIRPEEGLEVICTGKMSSYPARSNFQFVIEEMELAGEGALLKMLELRRKALASDGLFAADRKKKLPFLPRRIGVITSPTGAVIRDILHRLRERFPVHVLLSPVRVQGDTAAREVIDALHGFATLQEDVRPDVIIIARGGGSLEDLMPFNDEGLVRAVAACPIPVISAIGHETDTTLVDYAADVRAPTPTGAAEISVPVRAQLHAQVQDNAGRLFAAVQRCFTQIIQRLQATRLRDPKSVLEMKMQNLDHASDKLQNVFERILSRRREKLGLLGGQLRHPRQLVLEKTQVLNNMAERLSLTPPRLMKEHRLRLENNVRMLESLSFKSVLARGYAVVRDSATGALVTRPDQITAGQDLDLLFKDDKVVIVRAAPPEK